MNTMNPCDEFIHTYDEFIPTYIEFIRTHSTSTLHAFFHIYIYDENSNRLRGTGDQLDINTQHTLNPNP